MQVLKFLLYALAYITFLLSYPLYQLSAACETPTSPTNGAVTVSADGTTATYTCIANYTLTGDASRTCQTATNTWTGSDPMCSKKAIISLISFQPISPGRAICNFQIDEINQV